MKTIIVIIFIIVSFFLGSFLSEKNIFSFFKFQNNSISLIENKKENKRNNTSIKLVGNSKNSNRINSTVLAVKKTIPAVVFIGVTKQKIYKDQFFDDPFFWQFFPPTIKEFQQMGSGVIMNPNGYIVTNYHVVQNSHKISVYLNNGKKYKAKLIGYDTYTDLAILKIKESKLPYIKAMDANDKLMLGETAIAIGNPLGSLKSDKKPTVTKGVVSAIGREFKLESDIQYIDMIQTDASINPGNSGGALINADGKLIGINTFIFSPQGSKGSVGIGFAIPVNRVLKVLKEVVKYGRVRSFETGMSITPITRVLAAQLGLESLNGVLISRIRKNSPAYNAKLKVGDVVYKADNYFLHNITEVEKIFKNYFVGDKLQLTILRNKKILKRNIRLGELRE